MNLLVCLRKEMMEQWRSRRLLVVAVVLLFFGISSPMLAYFTPEILSMVPGADMFANLVPEPTVLDAAAQYVKNVDQFGVLLALLVSMSAVVVEKERGTAAMMLAKPLSRGDFLFAKFLALGLVFLTCLLVSGLGAWYYTILLFEPVNLGAWMGMNALLLLHILVWVAITLMFSVLLRSQAAAAGGAFGALMVISLLGSIPALGQYLPSELVNWGAKLAIGVNSPAWGALGVSLGIVIVCLIIAWLAFRRQEL
jgi:ABC-2 type transport system permease protein